jgi:hypothetical protein
MPPPPHRGRDRKNDDLYLSGKNLATTQILAIGKMDEFPKFNVGKTDNFSIFAVGKTDKL